VAQRRTNGFFFDKEEQMIVGRLSANHLHGERYDEAAIIVHNNLSFIRTTPDDWHPFARPFALTE
jgi:hypothetical protein